MSSPVSSLRRSPLRRLLDQKGGRWLPAWGTAIADETDGSADPAQLAFVDLSPLPRIGFKGPGTIDAMRKRGVALDAVANRSFEQDDGSLCLVLAPSEVLVLSGLEGDGERFAAWEAAFSLADNERTYPVPRRDSHAWIAVTGRCAPEMMAKLCAIDLRLNKFPDFAIAQTSVARITAIVARHDIGGLPTFHVLADTASSLYLSSCLLDAGREFGGDFVGVATLKERTRHEPAPKPA